MTAIVKPNRAQLEIGLLVGGTLLLLWLYRSYLERSLALQDQYMAELLAEREREHTAAAAPPGNGALDGAAIEDLVQRLIDRERERLNGQGDVPLAYRPPASPPGEAV